MSKLSSAVHRLDDLRDAETRRINEQMQLRAEQAAALADQVSASAETLRALVAATAALAAQQLTQVSAGISDRLSALEKSQYEKTGSSGGMRDMYGWIFGVVVVVIGFGLTIYFSLHK